MSNSKLGSLEITCDAPSYEVVWACEDVGFVKPLDVRWCRLSAFLKDRPGWWQQFRQHPWKSLWVRSRNTAEHCSCGQPLPPLEPVEFTFGVEKRTQYLLGQCPGCGTMFWEDLPQRRR
jgi:hypothetical protein